MADKNNLKTSVYARIEAIGKTAVSLRNELAEVVRELLQYVPDSKDIEAVNRLLANLNKTDRKLTADFFREFLPWSYNVQDARFGKMTNNAPRYAKMITNINAWLKNEHNTIWDWAKATRARPQKNETEQKIDITNRVQGTIERALSDKAADGKTSKPALDADTVLNAVVAAGISLEDIMAWATHAYEVKKAEEEKAAAAAKKLAEATVVSDPNAAPAKKAGQQQKKAA